MSTPKSLAIVTVAHAAAFAAAVAWLGWGMRSLDRRPARVVPRPPKAVR